MTIGEKIKKLRKNKKETQQKLAREIGIAQSTLGMIEKDRTAPGRETLKKLPEHFNVTIDYLLNDKEENNEKRITINDFKIIPMLGTIRAGLPILAEENLLGYYPVLKSQIQRDKEYFILRVKGDSMNLEFNEGSMLLIEKTPCIETGEIGVIRINSYEATVKKVAIDKNIITLIPCSNNPEYTPKIYDLEKDNVEIIGKVKQAIKEYY